MPHCHLGERCPAAVAHESRNADRLEAVFAESRRNTVVAMNTRDNRYERDNHHHGGEGSEQPELWRAEDEAELGAFVWISA